MRKETNDAISEIVKDLTEMPGGTGQKISMDMMNLVSVVSGTESDLYDCVNELCLKCGQYKRANDGACDDCRWLKVKEGFR